MEPFIYDEQTGIFWIGPWKERFPQIVAGFTSRSLHSSFGNLAFHVEDDPANVIKNREFLSAKLGVSMDTMTCAQQPHGKQVVPITLELTGAGSYSLDNAIKDTDGLFTDLEDTLLTLFYADCVPLFFYDPVKQVIGVAHAGWKGTVQNIGKEMIHHFERTYQSKAEDIHVAIGPSIGICCYQVDQVVMDPVRELIPKEVQEVASKEDFGKYRLDLRKLNQILLKKEGVLSQNIEITNLCTSCNNHRFFSHRKEQGKTGRMAAFVLKKGEGHGNG